MEQRYNVLMYIINNATSTVQPKLSPGTLEEARTKAKEIVNDNDDTIVVVIQREPNVVNVYRGAAISADEACAIIKEIADGINISIH